MIFSKLSLLVRFCQFYLLCQPPVNSVGELSCHRGQYHHRVRVTARLTDIVKPDKAAQRLSAAWLTTLFQMTSSTGDSSTTHQDMRWAIEQAHLSWPMAETADMAWCCLPCRMIDGRRGLVTRSFVVTSWRECLKLTSKILNQKLTAPGSFGQG